MTLWSDLDEMFGNISSLEILFYYTTYILRSGNPETLATTKVLGQGTVSAPPCAPAGCRSEWRRKKDGMGDHVKHVKQSIPRDLNMTLS